VRCSQRPWRRNSMGRMRLRVVALALFAFAFAFPFSAGAAPAFKVVFKAPKHTPKVNERWNWSVKVSTRAGKPLAARISAVVIDPIGGVHPVEYGCCAKKFVTNVKIKGTFRDYVQFPIAAKGYKVTFRVTVKTALGTRAVKYWVKTL
jgi:hypothetical protein